MRRRGSAAVMAALFWGACALAVHAAEEEEDVAHDVAQDVAKGRALASTLCAQCHLNEGQGEKEGPMGVPGFIAVANRPGQTYGGIVRWLKAVPPMMPDHHLTLDEIDYLAAFIMSLRTER